MFVNRKSVDRRVPAQARSRERVERILDAAAQVFARDGYEPSTMEAIAERADTSIGSIYQFFPNKLAVFHALARRYLDRVRGLMDLMTDGPLIDKATWPEILDASIDAWAEFHENDPGFHAVWVGLHLTEEVVSEGEALNRELARRLEAILAVKLPRLPTRVRPIAATMVVEVFGAMLVVTARRPKDRKAMLQETKLMLRRYLEGYEGKPRRTGVRSTR
jgi:AcrR family transcriptional regulator